MNYESQERYGLLVQAIAAAEDVDETEAALAIEDAGRTPEQFRADVASVMAQGQADAYNG